MYYNTVSLLLLSTLKKLMTAKVFSDFRLVGGTALSLQTGHRLSVDIDLFTDKKYGSVNFKTIDTYLRSEFKYVDTSNIEIEGMGRSWFVGKNKNNSVKLDVFYTDTFIRPVFNQDGIRMADTEDIIAMKTDVIGRGGRKKDFWDIHELLEKFTIEKMILLHKERYPYSHSRKEIKAGFTDFSYADNDLDPVCVRNKYWEVIKLDILDAVKLLK